MKTFQLISIIDLRGGFVASSNVETLGNHEDMASFFASRAAGYERHMQANVEDFDSFYRGIADALPPQPAAPDVLDLGIGTGLELDRLFERFPDARVTGIDLSSEMLDELARKDRPWHASLHLIRESFLELDLGQSVYDAVISSMALHHWVPDVKRALYGRIRAALRRGGTFVNADYVASQGESMERLAAFRASSMDDTHERHIDLPLTIEHEQELLREAGFDAICVISHGANACIFAASGAVTSAMQRG